MSKKLVLVLAVLSMGLLLAACTPAAATEDTMMEEQMPATGKDAMMESSATPEMMEEKPMDSMMEETATPEMMDAMPTDAMMEKTSDPMMEEKTPEADMMDAEVMMSPAWFTTQLTNEVTGETFKIEDFKGKVVLVEPFAQWCPTCLRQQNEVVKLHELLGMPDDLVSVSLDIDPNEDAEMLKTYLEKNGFDWHFAIAPAETSAEIGKLYGDQFLNPTSAPMLVIDRHGEAHPLPFGVKTAEDLQEALKPYLSDGM